jgi:hypothetical protein
MSNEELVERLLNAVEDKFIHDPWFDEATGSDYCVKCEMISLITEVYASA